MLSKSSKYALRAVLCLAVNSDETQKLSPKAVAEKIDIPVAYLASLLQKLSKKGIVSSTKGRNGGFYLSKKNVEIPLISIIDCIDGLDRFKTCMMGLPTCSDDTPCPVHHLFVPIKTKVLEEFKTKSIKDFAAGIINGETVLF